MREPEGSELLRATLSANIIDCINANIALNTFKDCANTNESGRVLTDVESAEIISAKGDVRKQMPKFDGRYWQRNVAITSGTAAK